MAHKIYTLGQLNHVPADIFNSWFDLTAEFFAEDNPRFNKAKYARACYEGKHIRKSIARVSIVVWLHDEN